MNYVTERYEEENGEDLTEDPETIASLYVDVETWKKALTSREKVNISVNGSAGRFREELTREKYEELTSDLLNRTKNLLDDVLATAEKQGYPISKIDKVLLVGGSSRMPQVAAMIERDYHVIPVLTDPDEAVAKGAAIYASNEKAYNDFVAGEAAKVGKSVEEIKGENLVTGEMDRKFALSSGGAASGALRINITNVLSRTYGLEVIENYRPVIANMLMINDKLPATRTETYYTLHNNQWGVTLKLYESRVTDKTMEIEDRTPITEIEMTFKQGVPEGTPVKMTMALDNSGSLHIIAEELRNHSKLDTTFQLSNQMTDAEMNSAALRMSSANIE
jgi:molecular chaperone DnaK (HSP70)